MFGNSKLLCEHAGDQSGVPNRQLHVRWFGEAGQIGPSVADGHLRLHDLRHSFAVQTLLQWYRAGGDVQVKLPLLSTYLGHIDPKSTYWYLSAAPELLAEAGARLQHAVALLRVWMQERCGQLEEALFPPVAADGSAPTRLRCWSANTRHWRNTAAHPSAPSRFRRMCFVTVVPCSCSKLVWTRQ